RNSNYLDESANYIGVNTDKLTVTNVGVEHAGSYRCAVTDVGGTIFTSHALLQTLVSPFIIQHPQSQTILQSDPLTVSVIITNVATGPFTYVWRKGSLPVATNLSVVHSNYLLVTGLVPASTNVNRFRCD